MSELAQRDCVPCRGGVPPLTAAQAAPLLQQLQSQWRIVERIGSKGTPIQLLQCEYRVADFASALRGAVAIGEIAERQQHHPDLHVAWGRLGVEIWTHKIGGLTESDFVFAAKCDLVMGGGS